LICPACGEVIIEENPVFCPSCGVKLNEANLFQQAPPESPQPPKQSGQLGGVVTQEESPDEEKQEKILVATGAVVHGDIMTWTYDLYFTDSRMVAIHTVRHAETLGLLAGGVIGEAIASKIDNRSELKEQMESVTLDEKLSLDSKSFSVPYLEIKELEMEKPLLAGGQRLEMKWGKTKKRFELGKPGFDDLCSLFPRISVLADRTRLPKK
jgi:hypothetical protein